MALPPVCRHTLQPTPLSPPCTPQCPCGKEPPPLWSPGWGLETPARTMSPILDLQGRTARMSRCPSSPWRCHPSLAARLAPSPGIPGGKKERGEREVLTGADRDIAGLGLQLGALAGHPSAPRGRAAPRPGPGPSPAGHRAQAPRGPLLPRAGNCNTAQPRGSSLLLLLFLPFLLLMPRLVHSSQRCLSRHCPKSLSWQRCRCHPLRCSSLPFGVWALAAHVPTKPHTGHPNLCHTPSTLSTIAATGAQRSQERIGAVLKEPRCPQGARTGLHPQVGRGEDTECPRGGNPLGQARLGQGSATVAP